MRTTKGWRTWRLYLALVTLGTLWLTPGTVLAADVAVDMQDDVFVPASSTVQMGDRVVWTNRGARPHTASSDTGLWDSGTVPPGGTYAYQFNQPGTFPYVCRIHGDRMRGAITVVATGTGPSGPAGSPMTGSTQFASAPPASSPPQGHAATPRHSIENAVPASNQLPPGVSLPSGSAMPTGATMAATAPAPSGPPRSEALLREAQMLLASPTIAPPLWLEIMTATPIYGTNGEAMGVAEPGEEYRVVLEDRDWALVRRANSPDRPLVWIALDRRVGYMRP